MRTRTTAARTAATSLTAMALVGAGLALAPVAHANPTGTGLVINEVYGAGGNTGALYNADYVEIYNPTSAAIDLTGVYLHYRSATYSGAAYSNIAPLSGAVQPHDYYLVQASAAGTVGSAFSSDLVSNPALNLAAAGGQVFLSTSSSAVTTTGNLAGTSGIIDLVSSSAATAYEGTVGTATGTAALSLNRTNHVDTDVTSADITTAAPTPQKSSGVIPLGVATVADKAFVTNTAITPFSVVGSGGTSPYTYTVQSGSPLPAGLSLSAAGQISGTPTAAGTFPVKVDVTDSAATPATVTASFSITVTDHPPLAATGPGDQVGNKGSAITPFTVAASGGTAPYTFSATGLPAGLTLATDTGTISGTPSATGTSAVTVTVTDADQATTTVSFSIVVGGAIVPIHDIQGIGNLSPYGAQQVTTQGVVTAIYRTGLKGFYIQEPSTDPAARDRAEIAQYGGNPSNAVFVYQSTIDAGLNVGDSVQVSGMVTEFAAGTCTSTCTQTTTEIVDASYKSMPLTVTKLATSLGTVVPYTGPGGGQGVWAGLDTAAEKESHEGELIDMQPSADQHWTVTDNYDTNWYGEILLARGDKQLITPTEIADAQNTGAVAAVTADNNARKIILDDAKEGSFSGSSGKEFSWLTPTNPVRIGSQVTFDSGDNGKLILMQLRDEWHVQPRVELGTAPLDKVDGSQVATFSDTRTANLKPADVLKASGKFSIGTFNVLNYFPTTGDAFERANLGTCTYYTDRASVKVTDNTCTITATGQPGPRGAALTAAFYNQEAKIVKAINTMGTAQADGGNATAIISLEEIENGLLYRSLIKGLTPWGTGSCTGTFKPTVGATSAAAAGTGTSLSCLPPGYDPTNDRGRDYGPARLVAALNAAAGYDRWAYVPSPPASKQPAVSDQDAIRTAFIYQPALVAPVGDSTILTGSAAFVNAREPLAQAFKAAGSADSHAFEVIVNHFKSKGSGTNDGTGQGNANPDRVAQATALVKFANDMADRVGTQSVFLTGDYNANSSEDPIQTIEAGGFTELNGAFNGGEYTYSFDGMAGSLDHVFANTRGVKLVTGVDVWQINAEEQVAGEYSRANYNPVFLYNDQPFRASDHNPEIIGIDPTKQVSTPRVVLSGDIAAVAGTPTTVGVRVIGGDTLPTGTVTLSLAGTTLATATVSADTATSDDLTDGVATLTLPAGALKVGDYVLSASYAGVETSRPSVTQVVVHVVAPASAASSAAAAAAPAGAVALTTLTSRVVNPKVHAKRTHVRVKVRITGHARTTVTGTVRVTIGSGKHARTRTVRVVNGVATLRLGTIAKRGVTVLKVAYSGSQAYAARTQTLKVRVLR
ncbi:putative Ig domain-containing protein [Nocardioides sp.]|uniref:putative Ig domain-containing protein n=1 Tax=Nocardioides sp. TaxID=35761 RepID=UPI002633C558|nr:putative Ig domain-containing protein [Nocardioides sp.]